MSIPNAVWNAGVLHPVVSYDPLLLKAATSLYGLCVYVCVCAYVCVCVQNKTFNVAA